MPAPPYEPQLTDQGPHAQKCASAPAPIPTTGQTNIGTIRPIDVHRTSGTNCSSLYIREPPQSDQSGTMSSASPLLVSPPGGDIQYVATERCEISQLPAPRASSTAVFSSFSSARNRHHGPTASASPVSVQPSTLVTNTLDSQPVPPSLRVVMIPETTNQPTTVPEVQRNVPNATQGRTDSTSSVASLPAMHEIRMDHHSPSLVRQSMPINNLGATGHNSLADSPQERSTSGSYHT